MTHLTKEDYKKIVLHDIHKETEYNKEPLKNMDLRIKMLDFFIDNNFDGDITDYKKILPDEDGEFDKLTKTNEKFKAIISGYEYPDVFCAYGVVSRSVYRVAVGKNVYDD